MTEVQVVINDENSKHEFIKSEEIWHLVSIYHICISLNSLLLTLNSLVAQLVKNLPAMQETWVQFPGLGRYPGEGNGNSLQHSCLEDPHGQRNLAGCSPWGHKKFDTIERLSLRGLGDSSKVRHTYLIGEFEFMFFWSQRPGLLYYTRLFNRNGHFMALCNYIYFLWLPLLIQMTLYSFVPQDSSQLDC